MLSSGVILGTVILTTLVAAGIVILLNLKSLRKGGRFLNFKSVTMQLIALTVWVAILGNILNTLSEENLQTSFIIFVVSIVIGVLLIHNIFRQIETKEKVDILIQKLQENNRKLKRLDEQKTEFVFLASHQLRSPLSSIRGYISMIQDGDFGEVPEKLVDPLNRISRSSTALGFLINDYLDVSKIEKGEMEYVIETIDVPEIIEGLVKEFRILADRESVNLNLEYKEGVNLKIRADEGKIKQIVSNLIDNAIKYTPEGGNVDVSIDNFDGRVEISVKDNGIGVKADEVEELFNKFNRTDRAVNMNAHGTGLGLFIAKVMTEAQDGQIKVISEGEGKGSLFSVEFPAKV